MEAKLFEYSCIEISVRNYAPVPHWQKSGYVLFNWLNEPHHRDACILPQLRTLVALPGTARLRRNICKVQGQTPSLSQAVTTRPR